MKFDRAVGTRFIASSDSSKNVPILKMFPFKESLDAILLFDQLIRQELVSLSIIAGCAQYSLAPAADATSSVTLTASERV
jgi:hypothetical protein